MQCKNSFFTRCVAASSSLVLVVMSTEVRAGGSDCRTGTSVKVCVEWTQGGTPVHLTNYTVDFSDASNPDVELQTGEDWTKIGRASCRERV